MSIKDYRAESRLSWGSNQEGPIDREQITLGCILRIADAVETVAKDRIKMESDLKYYKDAYRREQETIKALRNQITGLKAAKTKYKNQLNELKKGEPGE